MSIIYVGERDISAFKRYSAVTITNALVDVATIANILQLLLSVSRSC